MNYRTNTTIWVETGDNILGWGESGIVHKTDQRIFGWVQKQGGRISWKWNIA